MKIGTQLGMSLVGKTLNLVDDHQQSKDLDSILGKNWELPIQRNKNSNFSFISKIKIQPSPITMKLNITLRKFDSTFHYVDSYKDQVRALDSGSN